MTIDLDVNKAQALLKSAQELRTHWSGLINNVMNFAIVTNVAVWTLFIQAYIWDFRETQYWFTLT
jgi:large-conductance mechanosensitive channel